jgi:hypothetical protein
MPSEIRNEETRAAFYGSASLAKYIKIHGVPKTTQAFRDMVSSSSSVDLAGKKGLELISCLGQVTFFTHPQQVNIMDKRTCKFIALIAR